MNNKKGLMFFSSFLILIFHFWIYVFPYNSIFYNIEYFIGNISFIGVDLFFIVSAITISKSYKGEYFKFIKSRFVKIYIPFIIATIFAFFYFNYSFLKMILTISGIDLFINGGGSFLWFLPAIMLIYLLLPLYKKYDNKYLLITLSIIWITLVCVISIFYSSSPIFILLNRVPIIIIGYYIGKYNVLEKKISLIYKLLLFIIGILLLVLFRRTFIPFICDFYYIVAIPLVISFVFIFNMIKENKAINKLGSITLEIYIIQMIFGFKLERQILLFVNNKLLTNIIIICVLYLLALILNYCIYKITYIIKKRL